MPFLLPNQQRQSTEGIACKQRSKVQYRSITESNQKFPQHTSKITSDYQFLSLACKMPHKVVGERWQIFFNPIIPIFCFLFTIFLDMPAKNCKNRCATAQVSMISYTFSASGGFLTGQQINRINVFFIKYNVSVFVPLYAFVTRRDVLVSLTVNCLSFCRFAFVICWFY